MSDPLPSPAASPAPVAPEPSGGFFQNLLDVYFAPREAFTRICRRPAFLVPALLVMAFAIGFFAVWVQKVDAKALKALIRAAVALNLQGERPLGRKRAGGRRGA